MKAAIHIENVFIPICSQLICVWGKTIHFHLDCLSEQLDPEQAIIATGKFPWIVSFSIVVCCIGVIKEFMNFAIGIRNGLITY